MLKAKKLKWTWHYVDEGVMEPDEHGRWMVVGSIDVKINDLPTAYHWLNKFKGADGDAPLSLVFIKYGNDLIKEYNGHRFEVIMSYVDGVDNGLGARFFVEDFEEAKKRAQEELDRLIRCLIFVG